ncbi:MAG: hypothetical protein R2777_08900 [Chitinophagales bacterium]
MNLYQKVFENNKKVGSRKSRCRFFKHLSDGQEPEILYIGCSDSRVTAEDMTGVKQGKCLCIGMWAT